jgi:hypothetical protein
VISFRYHLISIVAVLLALALGVLVGASVLDKGLVERLERDTREWQSRANLYQGQVEAFTDDVIPLVLGSKLAGERVIVIALEGAPEQVLVGARRALDTAGADVPGVLVVGARIVPDEQEVRGELADALGVSEDTRDLGAEAAGALAARLAGDASRAGGGDLLGRLVEGGFLCPSGCPGLDESVLAGLGARSDMVLVLGTGDGEPGETAERFALPLVRDLVARGVDVAAGEAVGTDNSLVALLRSDDGPAGGEASKMVTVDDLDQPMGEVALVLGLERLEVTGQGGNYGVRPDAADGYLPA